MTDAVTDRPVPVGDQPVPVADQPVPVADHPVPVADQDLARAGRSWRPLALLVVGQLLAGVLAGLIWRAWAPTTTSYLVEGGDGNPAFVVPQESESQIAGDGRFVLLSIALGMMFGLLAWRLRTIRGPVVLAALAVGGVLSSLLARAAGEWFSGSPVRELNAAFTPELSLHALPALAVQAFFGVLVYTALVGLSADPDLGDRKSHS
jgi:hypothetical protein